ncbi:hypothetical protein LSCM1_06380 [Leishmania martiniquensis]|uniref:Uncharacterized protein n=1 Tax=Leishmania martiniquensis TaxID=1580590 RepID=A0A836KML9_9TRYP|nr:hypothetical protein LSCM1_06380 [Leishmania martiniquensis]
MTHSLVRFRTVVLLVALVELLGATAVRSYSVRYAGKVSPQGMMNFETLGYCAQDDTGHSMMPKLQSYQVSAAEVLSNSNFDTAPIGGESRQSACLDASCTWQFNHGLHYHNEITFFFGIVYKGNLLGGPADGVYNNFAPGQPLWWSNVSYWGSRQPYMMRGGQWANANVVTYYTQWVCEYYEYHQSDVAIFPTYPDGEFIVRRPSGEYYHCGRLAEVDQQGRWIYQRCKEPFPWWASLVIAIMSFIALITLIIVISCCRLYIRHAQIRKEQEAKLETLADNPAQVPTQTQMGLSRIPSCHGSNESSGEEGSSAEEP